MEGASGPSPSSSLASSPAAPEYSLSPSWSSRDQIRKIKRGLRRYPEHPGSEEIVDPPDRVDEDQLKKAAPVQGGIGKWLLEKMGWRPGEGLGKNNEGSKEPLMLDFKVDRKGLISEGENTRKGGTVARVKKDLSGKHPVSALTELCNKRRWGPPNFIIVQESGPDHKKSFLFKVIVNGVEYQSSAVSANKKLAKAQAASVCLQELGLIPRD